MVQDFGWGGDHVGKLHALQTAIKRLCGAGKVRERFDAGTVVSYDHELKPGWRHLAAVRQGQRLKLFVDGKLVATSVKLDAAAFDLTNDRPLTIGFGAHAYFRGSLSDLRLYGRALAAEEVAALAAPRQRPRP